MWRRFIAPRPLALALLLLAAASYSLLSVVNHLCFHTFGLDLGVYSHALYHYAHFQPDLGTFYLDHPRNLLSDHFDLYLPLLSPLVWIFGQYTLLVVQIAAVLFGAWGVYCLVADRGNRWVALAAMASFLSFFGIWQALAFDYHSNVVACMLLPWLILALHRGRYGWFAALTVLICLAKETMPLWLLFVMLALAWDYRRDRHALRWLAAAACFCLTYLVLVVLVVMPALCPDPSPGFWRYQHMGDSFSGMALWLLSHPLQALQQLGGSPQKVEFYLCLLASGGLLCLLRRPHWLLMLIPLMGQKMLSCDEAFWGIAYHYNVEFAVVVIPGVFLALTAVNHKNWRRTGAVLTLSLCIFATIYTTSKPYTWIRRENVRLLDARHYRNDSFAARTARETLRQVPANLAVCASSPLTPHLAMRPKLYLFPVGLVHQPDLLILTPEDVPALLDNPNWHLADTTAGLYTFVPSP